MSNLSNPATGAGGTAADYTRAILDLLGDRDPIDILRASAVRLRERVSATDGSLLLTPEAEGKWSVVEIVRHLADSEIAWAWRLRLVLAEDEPQLTPYDQDAWATRLGYRRETFEDAMELFEVNRSANLRLLDRLAEADYERTGVHLERGAQSVRHMIAMQAGHDLAHLRQVDRVLRALS